MLTSEDLDTLLSQLLTVGGIEAAAVVSRDGLVIRAKLPEGKSSETLAAMSATMLGAAETVMVEVEKGIPERIIVESKHGKLIAIGAGSKAILVGLTNNDATLGLALVELEKTAKKIKEQL
jgi:hypothetical protein